MTSPGWSTGAGANTFPNSCRTPNQNVISVFFVFAVAAFIGLVLFLFQLLGRIPDAKESKARRLSRLTLRFTVVSLGVLTLFCAVWSFFIEPNRLVVHEHTIQIENWPRELAGLRVALISDLHVGGWFIDQDKLRTEIVRTNQLNPDLIVLLGDYMSPNSWHSQRIEPEITAALLKDFHAPLGVFSVLGNHDWWYNGLRVRRALEQNGIVVLEDDVVEIKLRGQSFWLAGLADLWTRKQHIGDTLAKAPQGSTIIALTHNPDIFPGLPNSVPLLLAGHTHGGQVNLPLIGTPIVPSRFGSKYTAGEVFENGHYLFITTGIGTSIIPIRFRVPPEIALLTIQSKNRN